MNLDRWFEINLEFFNRKNIEKSVEDLVGRAGKYFEGKSGGISLIVEFHGDDIHTFDGSLSGKMPATMVRDWSYDELKRLVSALQGRGIKVAHSVQANYYEYVPSAWIANEHPELGKGLVAWIKLFGEMRADSRKYAAFPGGISAGTKYYEFFSAQWKEFANATGFDGLFLRDGWLGKSFQRDSQIASGEKIKETTEKYVSLFREVRSANEGRLLITWTPGMTADPLHSCIEIDRILDYVDIYITQSFAGAWQYFWPLFGGRTLLQGGYTPQILYNLINSVHTHNKCKHYILIDAWDWEGWDSFHVHRDAQRFLLWAMANAGLLTKEGVKLPDGVWIGQCMSHSGTPLYNSDFEWIAEELNKLEKEKVKSYYGPTYVYDYPSYSTLAKGQSPSEPDTFLDFIPLLQKFGVPILSVMPADELSDDGSFIFWVPHKPVPKLDELMEKSKVIIFGDTRNMDPLLKKKAGLVTKDMLPAGYKICRGQKMFSYETEVSCENSLLDMEQGDLEPPPSVIYKQVGNGAIILPAHRLDAPLNRDFLGALARWANVKKAAVIKGKDFDFSLFFDSLLNPIMKGCTFGILQGLTERTIRRYAVTGLVFKFVRRLPSGLVLALYDKAYETFFFTPPSLRDSLLSLGVSAREYSPHELMNLQLDEFDCIFLDEKSLDSIDLQSFFDAFLSNGGKLFCLSPRSKTGIKTGEFEIKDLYYMAGERRSLAFRKNNLLYLRGSTFLDIPMKKSALGYIPDVENALSSRLQAGLVLDFLEDYKLSADGPVSVFAWKTETGIRLLIANIEANKQVNVNVEIEYGDGIPQLNGSDYLVFDGGFLRVVATLDEGMTKLYNFGVRSAEEQLPHMTYSDFEVLSTDIAGNRLIANVICDKKGKLRAEYEGVINETEISPDADYLTKAVEFEFPEKIRESQKVGIKKIKRPRIAFAGKKETLECLKSLGYPCIAVSRMDRKTLKEFNVVFISAQKIKLTEDLLAFVKNGGSLLIFTSGKTGKRIDDVSCNVGHAIFNEPSVASLTPECNGHIDIGNTDYDAIAWDRKSRRPTWVIGKIGRGKISISAHPADLYYTREYQQFGPNRELLRNVVYWACECS